MGLIRNTSGSKTRSTLLFACTGAAALFALAGCASHPNYYAPPPPPPPPAYAQRPPLIELADQNGFRTGADECARDAYRGSGYHPEHDRGFRDTPGYDPSLGPFGPYRHAFRDAFLRGYDVGFHRQQLPSQ